MLRSNQHKSRGQAGGGGTGSMDGAGAELHQAIKRKDKAAIKRLAERADLSFVDVDGRSALHHAAAANDSDTLKLLLKGKGKPELNVPDKFGTTPLMAASETGSYKSAEALVKAGADPTKTTERGTVRGASRGRA